MGSKERGVYIRATHGLYSAIWEQFKVLGQVYRAAVEAPIGDSPAVMALDQARQKVPQNMQATTAVTVVKLKSTRKHAALCGIRTAD